MARVDVTLRGRQDARPTPARVLGTASVGSPSVIVPGATASTLIGFHGQKPSDARTQANDTTIFRDANTGVSYTDLDVYEGTTQSELVDVMDNQYKALSGMTGSGPLFAMTSQYLSGTNSPTYGTLAQKSLSKYDCVHLVWSVSSWSSWINPTAAMTQAVIDGLITPLGANQRAYIAFENEPAGDVGTKGTAAQYRQACARVAKIIKDNRGSKQIWGGTAYTANSLVNQNDGVTILPGATDWNLAPELEALGLNPATDVVMAQHGYCNPNSVLPSDRFHTVFNLLESWGFQRLGMGEGGTKSRGLTNYNRQTAWFDDLESFIDAFPSTHANPLEFWIYYLSGGSGGIAEADGWWFPGQWTGTVKSNGQPAQSDSQHTTTNQHMVRFAQIAKRYNGRT